MTLRMVYQLFLFCITQIEDLQPSTYPWASDVWIELGIETIAKLVEALRHAL